jgi:hypothetical protein
MGEQDTEPTFSVRHRLGSEAPILFRAELTDALRQPILDILRESVGTHVLMASLKRILDPYGMTPLPGRAGTIALSDAEVEARFEPAKRVLLECDWFRLYDVIEDVFGQLDFYESDLAPKNEEPRTPHLSRELNAYFTYAGIGWQVMKSRIVARGSDSFELSASAATDALLSSNRPTAAGHIKSAREALSTRPEANLSGAIYHAMGSLEAVARDLVGDTRATLGDILKQHPALVPAPLDKALSQVWGYASNVARHVVEGRDPTREDAELVVGLAATLVTYLTKEGRS